MKKKSFFKVLFTIGLLCSFTNIYATNITCPQGDAIKNLKIINARPAITSENAWLWLLNTDAFMHGHYAWNVWIAAWLPVITPDKAEAMKQGQAILNKLFLINNPEPNIDDFPDIKCLYTAERSNFKVMAISPPTS